MDFILFKSISSIERCFYEKTIFLLVLIINICSTNNVDCPAQNIQKQTEQLPTTEKNLAHAIQQKQHEILEKMRKEKENQMDQLQKKIDANKDLEIALLGRLIYSCINNKPINPTSIDEVS